MAVFSTALAGKDHFNLHTDLVKKKVKNIDNFYETYHKLHCVESVRISSFSGSYFPAFVLYLQRYGVSLHIQSKFGKIRTRKTPKTDNFQAVLIGCFFVLIVLMRLFDLLDRASLQGSQWRSG